MSRLDMEAALQAAARQRIVSVAVSRPDWPSAIYPPERPTGSHASIPAPDTLAAHVAPLAQPQSRRGRRRAAGKLKGAARATSSSR